MADASNPFLEDWDTPFGLPPFERIEEAHFKPALDAALTEWREDMEAIATNPDAPTFANTIEALELAAPRLDKVLGVFWARCGGDTTDSLQELEAEFSPMLSKLFSENATDPRTTARIVELYEQRDQIGLNPEQIRVLEKYHTDRVRAGAMLTETERARMTEIMARRSALGAAFSKNILADEKSFELVIEEGDLDGLPEGTRAAMARAAEDRGHTGKYAVTALRSSVDPFLQFSTRRDLREAAWRGFVSRGDMGEATSTGAIGAETLALRVERAALLGYKDYASYNLDDQMAKTPEAVSKLLMRVWERAKAAAAREAEALQALIAEEGGNFELQAWDWPHYAEKLRQRELALDDAEVKPYFELEQMIAASFDTASRLFGLSFKELPDAPRPHKDARVWDVSRDGAHVGIFIGDYFARPSKRSGAWMSGYRSQEKLRGDIAPIITNTCNFVRGEPTLLTMEDARTLFHEFGHALHGLLSDVTYPILSGTSVKRDFVELPSQLYEHWLLTPEVLSRFARHHQTGEPIPEALIEKLRKAQTFGKGHETVEYLASAIVDLELHRLNAATVEGIDPAIIEAGVLKWLGMPANILPRHKAAHFQHIFAGDGYAAGYYSYMWSEVMDADAFGAFEEAGDVFDPSVAKRLYEHIYSAGDSVEPDATYRAFRGREPEPDALLKRRGLIEDAA